MIHYLQYHAYVAKDKDIAVLNLEKKWFQDWYNVFDLYNVASVLYCTTINIPYTSEQFVKDCIAKFYVTGVFVNNNTVQLQLLFLQSQNKWLDSNSQLLGQVRLNDKTDYMFTTYVPIAQIKEQQGNNWAQALDYICSTFTQCVNQQFYLR